MRWVPLAVVVLLVGCGGSEPTGPSPITAPVVVPPIVQPDPARYDATFNAQLVHDGFEHPGTVQRATLLPSDPSIYLQTTGLTPAQVTTLEATARALVPAMSGDLRHLARFETGTDARPPQIGWIVVDLITDDAAMCGRALVGASAGHVWLNTVERCRRGGSVIGGPNLLAHELGHALGFWHVADTDAMMNAITTRPLPNDKEQYHASLAYQSNGAYTVGRASFVID